MTWPAPSDRPSPPPPAPPRRPIDRSATARPIATWLAATGGALVLVAAVIVVAGNWRDIAPWIKFAGLLAATGAVVVAAERSRRAVPATARALAHLGVALVAPVGIAAAAVAHGTWPTCVVAGGVAAAAAGELQRRRWAAPLLETAVVVAVGVAVTGLAGRTGLPVGVLGALVAVGFLVARRQASAVAFAIAAMGPTLVVTLTEWRVGPGTLGRIGVTGDGLVWSAPIAGVLAGGVLAVVATQRRLVPLAAAAMLAPVVGVVAGLAQLEAGPLLDASAVALGLLAVQALAVMVRREPWCRVVPPAADVLAVAAGVGALLAPLATGRGDGTGLPAVITAVALVVATLRMPATGLRTIVATGAVGAAIASVAATGASRLGVAVAATAVALACVLVDRRGAWSAPALAGAGWGVLFLVLARADGPWPQPIALVVVVALMGVATETVARRHASTSWSLIASVMAGACGAASTAPAHASVLFLAVAAAGVVHVLVRRSTAAPDVLTAVCVGAWYAAVGAAVPGVDPSCGLGLLALAVAAATTWWRTGLVWAAHAAAVAATAAVPFGLVAAGAGGAEIAAALLVGAVVLTGWSYVTVRITPLATAALAACWLATIVAIGNGAAVLVSLGVVVAGLQALLHGATRRSGALSWGGGGLAAAGAVSLWSTAGANAAVLDVFGPYGVTGADLAVAATVAGALVTGWLAGRRAPLSSWISTGPAIALAAIWLLDAETGRDVRWSLPALLTTGLVAALAGGVRRLAGPLVLGTATLGAALLVATGPRLAQLDSWAWLTIGGVLLIAVAVVVERAVGDDERDGVDWGQLRETWR